MFGPVQDRRAETKIPLWFSHGRLRGPAGAKERREVRKLGPQKSAEQLEDQGCGDPWLDELEFGGDWGLGLEYSYDWTAYLDGWNEFWDTSQEVMRRTRKDRAANRRALRNFHHSLISRMNDISRW